MRFLANLTVANVAEAQRRLREAAERDRTVRPTDEPSPRVYRPR
jgi:hypothetical protein